MVPVTQQRPREFEDDLGHRLFLRLSPVWRIDDIIRDFAPYGVIDYILPFKSRQSKYGYYAHVKYIHKESATKASQAKELLDKYDAILDPNCRRVPTHLQRSAFLALHQECGNFITIREAANHQAACEYQRLLTQHQGQDEQADNVNEDDEKKGKDEQDDVSNTTDDGEEELTVTSEDDVDKDEKDEQEEITISLDIESVTDDDENKEDNKNNEDTDNGDENKANEEAQQSPPLPPNIQHQEFLGLVRQVIGELLNSYLNVQQPH